MVEIDFGDLTLFLWNNIGVNRVQLNYIKNRQRKNQKVEKVEYGLLLMNLKGVMNKKKKHLIKTNFELL